MYPFPRYFTVLLFLLTSSISRSQITLINTGTNSDLNIPSIISNNILISGNINYLSKSYNDCDNLTPLTIPGTPSHTSFYQRLDTGLMFAFSANFDTYDFKIFKSLDDGQSWSKIFDSIGGSFFTHTVFFDENEGVIVSTFGNMARTKDGGNTWIHESVPLVIANTVRSHGDSILSIGQMLNGSGGISISTTRGNTWINSTGDNFGKLSQPTDIFFLNEDTIFGIATLGWDGVPFTKSFDGGKTWHTALITKTENITPNGIYARTKDEIYSVGVTSGTIGIILKTTDLGETWSIFNTGIKTELTSMKFLNDSIALVAGSNGVLFKWNSRTAIFTTITGVEEYDVNNIHVKLFPNPVKDKLHFEYSTSFQKGLKLTITNSLGQIVYVNPSADLKEELDLSFLRSGIYFLRFVSEKGYKVEKIIKE